MMLLNKERKNIEVSLVVDFFSIIFCENKAKQNSIAIEQGLITEKFKEMVREFGWRFYGLSVGFCFEI